MTRLYTPPLKSLEWLKSPEEYVRRYNAKRPDQEATRKLAAAPTKRQMATALEIIRRLKHQSSLTKHDRQQKGVLLADDVGLGKTTVGALVAGILAGCGFRVRVLAPNRPMARRWLEEIQSHQPPLKAFGYEYKVSDRFKRVAGGFIMVSTHRISVNRGTFDSDLMIVDEAHRAKNDASQFARALKKRHEKIGKILILTATPFSIAPQELKRMLGIVRAPSSVGAAIDAAAIALDRLWAGDFADRTFGDELLAGCAAAIKAIRPFVIRHAVSSLPAIEQKLFGKVDLAPTQNTEASDSQKQLLVRMDRVLDLGKRIGTWRHARTNDPRFHVGWRQLRLALSQADGPGDRRPEERKVQKMHIRKLRAALDKETVHPKVAATGADVLEINGSGERVVVFCDHHETAREVGLHLSEELHSSRPLGPSPDHSWLKSAYSALCRPVPKRALERRALQGFLRWLTADGMRAQVLSWLPTEPKTRQEFAREIRRLEPRTRRVASNLDGSIAGHVTGLWKSVRGRQSILSSFARPDLDQPGAQLQCQRIVVMTEAGQIRSEFKAAFHAGSPDVVLALFNSPFGPDVLVATDALSEGYDLHRYCRHVVHHELDPSPMRTIQRNGRLRRVDSWASRIGKPLVISYPVFGGTRDEQLVKIADSCPSRPRLRDDVARYNGMMAPAITR